MQIKILREVDKTKESILWLVANSGWNQGQKNDIKTAAYHWKDVDVRFFSKSSSMIDFMNKGVSNNRKDDLISGVFVFSHGFPGTISFGYHQDNEADLTFAAEQIKKLNQGIFKSNAYFVLYTCRAGSTKDGATNFAQTLADWTGRDVTATYSDKHTEGRTDYGNIMGLSFKEYLKLSAIEVSPKKIKELADIYNDSLEYEQKRKDAVGGIEKPYPAFQLPEPSGNPLTELDPHWVIYTPTK